MTDETPDRPKVVSLFQTVAIPDTADQMCVDFLRTAMESAERGEIVGVAFAGYGPGGIVVGIQPNAELNRLMGSVSALDAMVKFAFIQATEDE